MLSRISLVVSMLVLGALGSGLGWQGNALAQDDAARNYPQQPVRLVLPFAASGSTDLLGRLVGELLTKELGQRFVVLNVVGGGGAIGALQAARAAPDGYTLLIGTPGTMIINPNLRKDIGYDPIKDFMPVSFVWAQPSAIIVLKDSPLTSVKELITRAKRQPGKINFASAGVGSFNHMSGELFNSLAGIKMTHVPYQGVAPAMTDLMAKNVDVIFGTVASLLSFRDKLTGLAVASQTRSTFAPDVPTSAQAGLPEFLYTSWGGLFAPTGTSTRIAERLSAALARSLTQDSVKERFIALGVEAAYGNAAELQRHVAAEFKQTRQLIETAGIVEEK